MHRSYPSTIVSRIFIAWRGETYFLVVINLTTHAIQYEPGIDGVPCNRYFNIEAYCTVSPPSSWGSFFRWTPGKPYSYGVGRRVYGRIRTQNALGRVKSARPSCLAQQYAFGRCVFLSEIHDRPTAVSRLGRRLFRSRWPFHLWRRDNTVDQNACNNPGRAFAGPHVSHCSPLSTRVREVVPTTITTEPRLSLRYNGKLGFCATCRLFYVCSKQARFFQADRTGRYEREY